VGRRVPRIWVVERDEYLRADRGSNPGGEEERRRRRGRKSSRERRRGRKSSRGRRRAGDRLGGRGTAGREDGSGRGRARVVRPCGKCFTARIWAGPKGELLCCFQFPLFALLIHMTHERLVGPLDAANFRFFFHFSNFKISFSKKWFVFKNSKNSIMTLLGD
jgi:hypothetical protein